MRYKESNHKLNTIWVQSNKNTLNIKDNKYILKRLKNNLNRIVILYESEYEPSNFWVDEEDSINLNPTHI